MSKNNIIDLDEILGEPRKVRYQGTDYEVKDPTLAEVLKIQNLVETEEDPHKGMADAVRMMVPDLADKVEDMPLRAIGALFHGITSSLSGGSDEVGEPSEGEVKN